MKVGSAFKKLLGGSKGKPKDKPKGRGKKGDKEVIMAGGGDKDLDDKDLDGMMDGLDEMGDMEDIDMITDEEDEEEEEKSGSYGVDSERLVMQLKETDGKIDKVEQNLTSVQSENENIRQEVSEVKDDIRKLLSIYEIVFKDINPFIDEDTEDTIRLPSPFDEEEMELPSPLIPDEEEASGPAIVSPIISIDTGSVGMDEANDISSMIKQHLDSGNYEEAIHVLKNGIESLEEKAARTGREKDERSELTAELLGRSSKGPILKEIPTDYISNVTLLRWLEFLLERLPRKRILLALEYYVSVGWISSGVRYKIVGYLRGEMGGVVPPAQPHPPAYTDTTVPGQSMGPPRPPRSQMPELKPIDEQLQPWNMPPPQSQNYQNGPPGSVPPGYRGRNGALNANWRLSAEDHLKSLLFINMIAGYEIDRDRLSCREYDIDLIKHALEGYHGI